MEEVPPVYITMVYFLEGSTEFLMLDVEDPRRGIRASSREEFNITQNRVVAFHRDLKGETIMG